MGCTWNIDAASSFHLISKRRPFYVCHIGFLGFSKSYEITNEIATFNYKKERHKDRYQSSVQQKSVTRFDHADSSALKPSHYLLQPDGVFLKDDIFSEMKRGENFS